jgi:hypothetical protein
MTTLSATASSESPRKQQRSNDRHAFTLIANLSERIDSNHLFLQPPLYRQCFERSMARCSVKISVARRLIERDIAPSCIISMRFERCAQPRAEWDPRSRDLKLISDSPRQRIIWELAPVEPSVQFEYTRGQTSSIERLRVPPTSHTPVKPICERYALQGQGIF